LANHIVSLYSKPGATGEQPRRQENLASNLIATNLLPRDFLAKYISYARKYCQPRLSDEAEKALIAEYSAMRNMGDSKKTITATPR
jgi:DNA replicative helicase MCM subunit Mcm2 (Cdc46/Mcm family)